MKRVALVALIFMSSAIVAEGNDLMAGKRKTERTIRLESTVALPIEEVFALWSTEAGTRKFFGGSSKVDGRVGEDYTIVFDPVRDPEGRSTGTKGARLLALAPPTHLAFEWIPFIADKIDRVGVPPYAPPAIRNANPLQTWVEIDLEPLGPSSTKVRLTHFGFGDDELWNRSFVYFRDRAWPMVLDRLVKYGASVPAATKAEVLVPPKFDSYYYVLLTSGANPPKLTAAEAEELQNKHLAHLKKLYASGELLAMGPFQVGADSKERGMMIFRGDLTIERVRELTSGDPAIASGRNDYQLLKWLTPAGALAPGTRTLW